MSTHRRQSARRLVAYLMLWKGPQASAMPQQPQPQPTPTSNIVAPVTSVATLEGKPVTATYTPTSIVISGLTPPITAGTTVTTTDSTGETVAVAIAAGAGIVAAGAIAAWIFKPQPGGPPAPTEPPSYPTSSQENERPKTTNEPPSTTTEDKSSTKSDDACPFPTDGADATFKPPVAQRAWTGVLPSQTAIVNHAKCKASNNNGGLAKGADPKYIQELSAVFCKNDQSKDAEKTLGKKDLPDGSAWKKDGGPKVNVKFTYKYKSNAEGCANHCPTAYSNMISSCKYDSHGLFGSATLEQGCGTYALEVSGNPITKLTCRGDGGNPLANYMYRGAALQAIDNFCKSQNGKVVKHKDEASFIKETSFSVRYADTGCGSGGGGAYTIEQDLCIKYLSQALDQCDTNTILYKHGGSVLDEDNCGLFEFHPVQYDNYACYPKNAQLGYITENNHVSVTKPMAQDAIDLFCGREGDGHQYTLDPASKPPDSFVENTCKHAGMASCGSFYRNDGPRVNSAGEGDIYIRISASYHDPEGHQCAPKKPYAIHGERCRHMLAKLIGEGVGAQCIGPDANKLDLGSFMEAGELGCVTWNMWAVSTR